MYEQHFGFQRMPFSTNPAEWQFFDSESSAALLPKIRHTLESSSGVAVVTGPEGIGKTVLLHHLQAMLSTQGQAMILPGTSLQSVEDFYVCIRRSLKTLDGQQVAAGPGRWDVVERLRASAEFWGPIGLLVDDAHLLTAEIFTELQFLLEQRTDSHALCRILLAGSHALEETLARPALCGFAQRIRTYSFLQSLRLAESIDYLKTRLTHAGGALAECFDSDAVEAIVEAADGIPRCLNLLSDESLVLAFHDNQDRVTLETVRSALSSLQQLPQAWNVSVSDHSNDALNDTAYSGTNWQSSSDGVIEIGAPPESNCMEIGAAPAVSDVVGIPSEVSEQSIDSDVTELEAAAALTDDLPLLDDLTTELWLDDSDEDDSPSPIVSESQFDSGTVDPNRTFDAGYLLAELESVGDPAIEIDGELDRRLLQIAAAADTDSTNEYQTKLPLEDSLQDFPQWNPAGIWPAEWSHQSDLIRHGVPVEESVHGTEQGNGDSDAVPTMTGSVRRFEFDVPSFEEPVPVWPADSSGVSPDAHMPVDDLTARVCHDFTPEPVESESHKDQIAREEKAHGPWSDGQLLNGLADAGSDVEYREEAEHVVTSDNDTGGVRLKIADLSASSSEVATSETTDDRIAAPAATPDQMFTLPIALDDVTGERRGLAHSVRDLQEEFGSLRRPASIGTFSTGEVSPPSVPADPRAAGNGVTANLQQESIVKQSDLDAQRLIRPQLVGQARHLVSAIAPVQQLRPAAGAENCMIQQEVGPTLSVMPGDEPAESQVNDSADKVIESKTSSNGFHNLFTRLRQRTS